MTLMLRFSQKIRGVLLIFLPVTYIICPIPKEKRSAFYDEYV